MFAIDRKLTHSLPCVDFGSCIGCYMETIDSTHVLLDEPFLCIQSFAILRCICRHWSVLLCYWRHVALSQYFWLGDCWTNRSIRELLSHATTACVEHVLLLSIARDTWIVHFGEYLSKTPNGMGSLCTAIHFCRNLSRAEQLGAIDSIRLWSVSENSWQKEVLARDICSFSLETNCTDSSIPGTHLSTW